ncbi:MFS transporter [Planctomonas psychrotolerans]|uniref:MFS transporter n=1 Tax=Planctomonas psychrotolerans TaxID=2528712 RepID=UPI001D0D3240|nr:MFS transporter [Planctomonas psychrotolerans]
MSVTSSVATPAPTVPRFPYLALIMLGVAIFLNVTIEMVPTGLLTLMSDDLDVSESSVGLLVTVFAFTVVVTSAPLVALTRRLPRHALVVGVLAVFAASSALTAVAPTYELVVASRIVGGLAHGVFWSVVGAYSAYLVPKEQLGRAVSITLGGGSLAFVLGVPLGTALGQWFGWRATFGSLAALVAVGALLVWRFLPRVDHLAAADSEAAARVDEPRRRDHSIAAVAVICVLTALLMVGQYTFYTYITPFFLREVGVGTAAISPLLLTYGVAGAVGLALVGAYFGRWPRVSLVGTLVLALVVVATLGTFPAMVPLAVLCFAIWGLVLGGLPALLQTRLLHAAPARIRDTSSAFFTTSFNIGIGGGALVGALVLDSFGLATIPFVYVGILVVALVVLLGTDVLLRRPLRTQ